MLIVSHKLRGGRRVSVVLALVLSEDEGHSHGRERVRVRTSLLAQRAFWPLLSNGACLLLLRFRAIEKLSGHQFENYSFKISYIPDEEVSSPSPPQRAQRGDHSSREQGHAPGGSSQARQIDFPLRILVPTQFVGAIIGKEGLTIKNITKQTQSRYVPPGLPVLPSEGSPECWGAQPSSSGYCLHRWGAMLYGTVASLNRTVNRLTESRAFMSFRTSCWKVKP